MSGGDYSILFNDQEVKRGQIVNQAGNRLMIIDLRLLVVKSGEQGVDYQLAHFESWFAHMVADRSAILAFVRAENNNTVNTNPRNALIRHLIVKHLASHIGGGDPVVVFCFGNDFA